VSVPVYVNFPYFLFSVVNAFFVYLYCVAFSHVRLLHVNKRVSQSVSQQAQPMETEIPSRQDFGWTRKGFVCVPIWFAFLLLVYNTIGSPLRRISSFIVRYFSISPRISFILFVVCGRLESLSKWNCEPCSVYYWVLTRRESPRKKEKAMFVEIRLYY